MPIQNTSNVNEGEKFKEIQRHIDDVHNVRKLSNGNKTLYKCANCEQIFGEKSTLLQHNISEHQKTLKTLYKCAKCEKMFGEKSTLLQHNISEHQKALVVNI